MLVLSPSFKQLLTGDLPNLARTVETQRLCWRVADEAGVTVYIRRDDAIHSELSGNKLYKLHGHLQAYFQQRSALPIASFGGAYSNHLHALAAAGEILDIATVGVVRGERPKKLAPTLEDCIAKGMKLHFVSRERYKRRGLESFQRDLEEELGETCFWVPEGGAGKLGSDGCRVLGRACCEFLHQVDPLAPEKVIALACGTGTTFTGVANGAGQVSTEVRTLSPVRVLGLPVLKVGEAYENELAAQTEKSAVATALWPGAHCGGYAKVPEYLLKFMIDTERELAIRLDPVYTAKLMYGLAQLMAQGAFKRGASILAVHSGGLQGRRGFAEKLPAR